MGYLDSEDRISIIETHGIYQDSKYHLTFSVGATRSASEYILALAAAIFVADLFQRELEEAPFWGYEDRVTPGRLLEELKLQRPPKDFLSACEELIGDRA